MFAIANVLCLTLKRRRDGLKLAGNAGFKLADQGTFNGNCFLLLEKADQRRAPKFFG
jgi:hypothetical protein